MHQPVPPLYSWLDCCKGDTRAGLRWLVCLLNMSAIANVVYSANLDEWLKVAFIHSDCVQRKEKEDYRVLCHQKCWEESKNKGSAGGELILGQLVSCTLDSVACLRLLSSLSGQLYLILSLPLWFLNRSEPSTHLTTTMFSNSTHGTFLSSGWLNVNICLNATTHIYRLGYC